MRVLALDYGTARCGCAISDPTGTLATPIEAVERPDSKSGLRRVAELVQRVRGRAGRGRAAAPAVRRRLRPDAQARAPSPRRVASVAEVPVELFDERFTTVIAQRHGGRAERGLARRRRAAAELAGASAERRA